MADLASRIRERALLLVGHGLPAAEFVVDAVSKVHRPAADWSWKAFGCDHDGAHTRLCGTCRTCYPCPTVSAVAGALGVTVDGD